MKLGDINQIEDKLKATLEDEKNGIKSYDALIAMAERLGATATAGELRKIKNQESQHATKIKDLIALAEINKVALKQGEKEEFLAMEPRHRYGSPRYGTYGSGVRAR